MKKTIFAVSVLSALAASAYADTTDGGLSPDGGTLMTVTRQDDGKLILRSVDLTTPVPVTDQEPAPEFAAARDDFEKRSQK